MHSLGARMFQWIGTSRVQVANKEMSFKSMRKRVVHIAVGLGRLKKSAGGDEEMELERSSEQTRCGLQGPKPPGYRLDMWPRDTAHMFRHGSGWSQYGSRRLLSGQLEERGVIRRAWAET